MRMWANLTKPFLYSDKMAVQKIMIHDTKDDGVYVYLYKDKEDLMCSVDENFPSVDIALERWNGSVDSDGWHVIDDPMPYCQDDCILHVRVKGRDVGKPQWGKFEILKNGEWVELQQ